MIFSFSGILLNLKTDLQPVTKTTSHFSELPKHWLDSAYQNNQNWCIRYVIKNQGSEQEAKDIFQDSLAAAWVNLRTGKFEGNEENFHGYIRQICKYKWLNELKRKGRFTNAIDLERMDATPDDNEDLNLLLDETDILMKSIESLGDNCKVILKAFYYLKESLTEIAHKMGTTDQSIKTIKYRCMNRLRKAYIALKSQNER